MNKMTLDDQCGAIKYINKLAKSSPECEHCALGIAELIVSGGVERYRLRDYCMVQDVGGTTDESASIIPSAVSYSLLKVCDKEGYIPIVMHTHIIGYEYSNPLSFSPQDKIFMTKFAQFANRISKIPSCIFVVSNGWVNAYCFIDLTNNRFRFQEELTDDHIEG